MAGEKDNEFSSLTRAKLHNQGSDEFVFTCNNCKSHVETRYHCTVCDDFDLCISCKEKDDHGHEMIKFGFDLDDGSSPANSKQQNPKEARKLSILKCIESLVHACQCRDANCRLPRCSTMKKVIQHTKVCKRRTNGGCSICKQLIALCCYHAKHCQETECLVPFCSNIKNKLKQQQLQQRIQQAQLLRRRMAAMNEGQTGAQVNAIQDSQQTPTPLIQQQQQSIPISGVGIGIVDPGGVGVGGGPGVGPPNTNMQSEQPLQQLSETLRSPSTPEQQSQILQILQSNPLLIAAFIEQRQQHSGQ